MRPRRTVPTTRAPKKDTKPAAPEEISDGGAVSIVGRFIESISKRSGSKDLVADFDTVRSFFSLPQKSGDDYLKAGNTWRSLLPKIQHTVARLNKDSTDTVIYDNLQSLHRILESVDKMVPLTSSAKTSKNDAVRRIMTCIGNIESCIDNGRSVSACISLKRLALDLGSEHDAFIRFLPMSRQEKDDMKSRMRNHIGMIVDALSRTEQNDHLEIPKEVQQISDYFIEKPATISTLFQKIKNTSVEHRSKTPPPMRPGTKPAPKPAPKIRRSQDMLLQDDPKSRTKIRRAAARCASREKVIDDVKSVMAIYSDSRSTLSLGEIHKLEAAISRLEMEAGYEKKQLQQAKPGSRTETFRGKVEVFLSDQLTRFIQVLKANKENQCWSLETYKQVGVAIAHLMKNRVSETDESRAHEIDLEIANLCNIRSHMLEVLKQRSTQ